MLITVYSSVYTCLKSVRFRTKRVHRQIKWYRILSKQFKNVTPHFGSNFSYHGLEEFSEKNCRGRFLRIPDAVFEALKSSALVWMSVVQHKTRWKQARQQSLLSRRHTTLLCLVLRGPEQIACAPAVVSFEISESFRETLVSGTAVF